MSSQKTQEEDRQTPELCTSALNQNVHLLKYVGQEDLQTPELCPSDLEQNGHLLQYVGHANVFVGVGDISVEFQSGSLFDIFLYGSSSTIESVTVDTDVNHKLPGYKLHTYIHTLSRILDRNKFPKLSFVELVFDFKKVFSEDYSYIHHSTFLINNLIHVHFIDRSTLEHTKVSN